MNQEVIERLQTALKHNPEIDLRRLIPEDYYERKRGKRRSGTAKTTPSKQQPNGKHQRRGFYAGLVAGLLSTIPENYRDQLKGKHHSGATNTAPVKLGLPKRRPAVQAPESRPGPADFCANLIATAHTATIVHPLSNAAATFLAGFLESNDPSLDPSECLLPLLKRMILKSEKLWEFPTRGVVLKCNDELAVKIVHGYNDYTEYTSMQYLAEHAPDIPAPKPHGFVKLNNINVIFMTYFPSTTLEKVWDSLTHNNKVLIQHQLD